MNVLDSNGYSLAEPKQFFSRVSQLKQDLPPSIKIDVRDMVVIGTPFQIHNALLKL